MKKSSHLLLKEKRMIAYNITTKVRQDILEAWLAWQLEEQIPGILATGLFESYQLYRLLEQDEEDGPTFVIQFLTTSFDHYREFMAKYSYALQKAAKQKWGDRFVCFETIMQSL